MTHRYAEVMGWLAEGKPVLGRFKGGEEALFPNDFTTASAAGFLMGSEGWEFRLKPRTVKIGSREVEAPVLRPEQGQKVWYTNQKATQTEIVFDRGAFIHIVLAGVGRLYASEKASGEAFGAITALLRGEA